MKKNMNLENTIRLRLPSAKSTIEYGKLYYLK